MLLPYTSLRVKLLDVEGKRLLGLEVDLPNAPPLVLIRGDEGFIMCGYINIAVADNLNLVAARVTGVKSVEEMLEKEINEATSKAEEKGIRRGLKVRDVLKYL